MVIIKMQVNGQKLVIVEEESQADSQENVGSDGDERNQSDYSSAQGFWINVNRFNSSRWVW